MTTFGKQGETFLIHILCAPLSYHTGPRVYAFWTNFRCLTVKHDPKTFFQNIHCDDKIDFLNKTTTQSVFHVFGKRTKGNLKLRVHCMPVQSLATPPTPSPLCGILTCTSNILSTYQFRRKLWICLRNKILWNKAKPPKNTIAWMLRTKSLFFFDL